MNTPKNLVGPQVRQIRAGMCITQPMLAARCQIVGLDVSRETIAKIESRIRWVSDFELLALAKALDVPMDDLLPKSDQLPGLLNQLFKRTGVAKAGLRKRRKLTP